MVPVTMHKAPCLLDIVAVLPALWLGAHVIGRPRGTPWGMWKWLLRVGFCRSDAAPAGSAGNTPLGLRARSWIERFGP